MYAPAPIDRRKIKIYSPCSLVNLTLPHTASCTAARFY